MRYTAKLATVVALIVALGGCAMSSGHKRGPNGRPTYYVDGMTPGAALKKAEKLCPNGYGLIGSPRYASPVDYVMNIECKAPGTETPAVASAPPAGRAQVPLFEIDTTARCRELRENGGALLQVTCLENEPTAKVWLQATHTTPEIAVLCGRVLQKSRSYIAAKTCVEEQERAENRLPPAKD